MMYAMFSPWCNYNLSIFQFFFEGYCFDVEVTEAEVDFDIPISKLIAAYLNGARARLLALSMKLPSVM